LPLFCPFDVPVDQAEGVQLLDLVTQETKGEMRITHHHPQTPMTEQLRHGSKADAGHHEA